MFVTIKRLLWAIGLLLSPVLLFLLLVALLYLPPVQNWVVDKVAAIASEKTGMEITVGHVNLEWPLDLGIDGFRAIHEGDTLADIGHLSVDVQLRPLFDKRIVINQLALQQAALNTNGFISDLRVKGHVGELWLRSNGIDLGKETVEMNGARLADADLDIALSDTAAVDTTTTQLFWRINADSISISRTSLRLSLPEEKQPSGNGNREALATDGDARTSGVTQYISAYMGHAVAREADIDLETSTYRIGSLDWTDGKLSYDNVSQPTTALDQRSPATEGTQEGLDANHIALSDIRLGIDSIYYGPKGISLYVRETQLKEQNSRLEITQLKGGVRLDTAFTHIEVPHLVLRTPDSDLEAEISTDFSVADAKNPGKMRVRLNAQIGKQDMMRFMGNMPRQFIRQYPNHPLSIKGSINGNVERMEFTGLDINLPTALHVKADGYAYHVTDLKKLRGEVSLKAEGGDLNFVTALVPDVNINIPKGATLSGRLKADRQRYDADLKLRAGDMRADLTLRDKHAVCSIAGSNNLFDGSVDIDATLDGKQVKATLKPQLNCLDLYALKLSDEPLTIGMNADLTVSSDMNESHEVKGLIDNLYITDEKATYHPEKVGVLVRTNRDTTLARIQSGDFIVKLDANSGYQPLLKKGTTLVDSVMAQYKNKVIDQQAIKRLLPTMKLHVEVRHNNPIASLLRTKDISFKELLIDLNTSAETGVNGQMHLYSLNYDSTRIDTIRLALTQKGERMTYQGQVRNNRRNPQFVFNALFDGHIHENGALVGVRYYDDKDRMGVRLGATASMVEEGIRIQLMPERPTIGYKEFNLNKDNFLLIDKNNRLQAMVDLIADDKTGVKIYTENQDSTMLQDLTVSLYRIDLAEVTSVLPYLPHLSGKLNGDYHIVMDREEHISIVSDMAVEQMTYEGAPIGNISSEFVYMQREDGGHAVEARLLLDDEEFGLLQGTLTPNANSKNPSAIDATFTMTRFPLSIANGFIPDQLIGLEGYGEGELTIKGTTDTPNVNGEVYLDSAYLISVPYGVRMRFDNDPVRIVGSNLLLENFGLYAYNEEPLNMQGNIDFSNLDKIKMDMRMRARNLLLINTRQEAKSIAFGKAYVNFYARMNGPLEALSMRGRLDVLPSTDMTYMLLDSPLSTDNRLDELVKFTDFNDTTQTASVKRPTPSGLDMDLTLSVSNGAHIVCNLNLEQTNYIDLMGGGDLRMRYGGTEGLTLSGRYTLSNGEMKYSLPVIPLKTFTIQNGSYVEFTGDPMNPRLNITATERTKAAVGQEGAQSRSVVFDCGVVITKTLNDMGLQFIISAPEDMAVNSELQSMSEEERGKLAVTMLTTGMYLADGNTSGFSMNSVLSAYLQSEINNITGSALKTLDLSVGMDNTTDASGQMHTDYSFKFSKRLFDNRLKIQLGGKVSSGANEMPGQRQSFFDNVTMEYRLDQNAAKNVKLFYQQNVYDWLDGYTGLYGAGYVWRKKMDSLLDVFKMFSKESQQQPMMMRPRPTAPSDSLTNDTLRHEIR